MMTCLDVATAAVVRAAGLRWTEWSPSERAVFVNQLNRPHAVDAVIKERDKKWAARGIDLAGPIVLDYWPTVAELLLDVLSEIEQAKARIEAYDERAAIQAELIDDGLSASERAIAALKRPARFAGEHDCARAWLRQHAPNACIYRKVAS
jgi:hypothetical protein